MTLDKFISMPKHFTLEEWEKHLKRKHYVETRIGNLLNNIVWEAEGMEVFTEDEYNHPQYIKHKENHDRYYNQFTKYMNELVELKRKEKLA